MMNRLGDYIRPVDVRNRDLKVTRLMGINIEKRFMPSVANVVGTDLSNYKVVSKGLFACNLMHVGRDEKIPVALQKDDEPIIVSPAYVVFEVVDTNVLLTEYLMMWFSRSEFDRNAWFYTDGDVRGGMDRDALFDMQIPVPAIEKQREIVAEYNTLATRIETNRKLIATLEQTAQTLYRHTFVDNIDPNNLPKGWRMGTLGEIAEFGNGKLTELCDGEYPVYGGNGIVGFTDEFNAENVIVIGRVGVNCGCLYLEPNKCWINDNAIKGFSTDLPIEFLFWHMKNMDLNAQSEGSSQPLITQGILNNQECLLPSVKCVESFADKVKVLMNEFRLKEKENQTLTQMQALLLSKMGLLHEV